MRRRTLLVAGAGAAGALVVGWSAMPPRSRLGRAGLLAPVGGAVPLNAWIEISATGDVLLAMNRAEMGQGVHTALSMLVAEELDVPLARVRLFDAGADTLYGNVAAVLGMLPLHPDDREPGAETLLLQASHWFVGKTARELGVNATGGSTSVADAWQPLRLAAATARAQLLGAAAISWKLPVAELTVSSGEVRHESGAHAHYGDLARVAAATPPGEVVLKRPQDWTLIGTRAPRVDLPAKVDGSARFGLDLRLPGLLYAVVRQCPVIGGGVGRFDAGAALALPGVLRWVRLGVHAGSTDGIAVVARSTWHAMRGAAALDIDWRAPPAGSPDSAAIEAALVRRARAADAQGDGWVWHRSGDAAAALAGAEQRVEAVYQAPYLAHLPMEPLNCTARVGAGKVELWVGTQVPTAARRIAAQVAGVAVDAVTLHTPYLGGGFGRRLEVDFIGQAVRVALETGGAPVMLVWPREEDLAHDFYRPPGAAVLRGGLDASGKPVALTITSAGEAPILRLFERTLPHLVPPFELPDRASSEGLFDLPYRIEHQRIAHVATRDDIPVGSWRSVGHAHNAFFSESFIDELAFAAQRDPLVFRRELLAGRPRHLEVLALAAQKSQWGQPLPAGRARGLALHESYGSIVAQVAEVSLDAQGPRVHRVVCAVEAGVIVNPNGAAQQIESAVMFGLAAALYGGIDVVGGVVQQKNFPDQPLVPLARTPLIETHFVSSTRAPSGLGEPGLPPLAPAVGNALFALTGRRLRRLPLAR